MGVMNLNSPIERELAMSLTAEGLKKEATELMLKNGDNSAMYDQSGGVVGHLLSVKLLSRGSNHTGTTQEMVSNLLEFFGIPEDWVPPAVILRDVLPHFVHLKRLLFPLTGGNIARREELMLRLGRIARDFKTPDEAVAMSSEWLQDVGAAWGADLPG